MTPRSLHSRSGRTPGWFANRPVSVNAAVDELSRMSADLRSTVSRFTH